MIIDEMMTSFIREVINVLDRMGNAPLHYATQMWSQSVVRMLLERGANIGMKVRRKWMPSCLLFTCDLQCVSSACGADLG